MNSTIFFSCSGSRVYSTNSAISRLLRRSVWINGRSHTGVSNAPGKSNALQYTELGFYRAMASVVSDFHFNRHESLSTKHINSAKQVYLSVYSQHSNGYDCSQALLDKQNGDSTNEHLAF
ncbi:hypothetical protein BDEG_21390 [Batrachochytrium dendrobatidis JEL423]|uniref:Uncharacterized protein n=1 Tax=Batrachochytrium dendrobatidis (strain JEL423) TaxID=403673 RepID=A0A177WCN7_BATDL|nr:hypothetical protein BDEG_21390 [Batrachochytrium dendrobatidis JEL423]